MWDAMEADGGSGILPQPVILICTGDTGGMKKGKRM